MSNFLQYIVRECAFSQVGTAIAGLRRYTVFHFDREIELLEQVPTYPKDELRAHKAAHKMFVDTVVSFEQRFQSTSMAAVCELVSGSLLTFLFDWLGSHIQNIDMKLAKYFSHAKAKVEFETAMDSAGVDVRDPANQVTDFPTNMTVRTEFFQPEGIVSWTQRKYPCQHATVNEMTAFLRSNCR